MTRKLLLVLASILAMAATTAQVNAQVIVLPAGQSTSIGTTVHVPDGGFLLLGNVHYRAEGIIQRGIPRLSYLPIIGMAPLLGHRAITSEKGETQIYLGVRIHDFKTLDQATFLKGQQIIEAKRTVGLLPAKEEPLPTRIPSALKRSFSSER